MSDQILRLAMASCLFASLGESAEPIRFIDTSFENASPLDWHVDETGVVQVDLIYDHERSSPNRAAGHWHFRLEGDPASTIEVQLNHFQNIWNGRPGSFVSDQTITFVSENGQDWQPLELEYLPAESAVKMQVTLSSAGDLFVARLPPYRISDLDRLLDSIRNHPLVSIETIGKTVQGRSLEMVHIGKDEAPYRVFLRGRAHPWEPGGNWVLDGMMRFLTSDTPASKACLEKFSVAILPMANKDGVANGRTRFNLMGKDLNRDWDAPADPKLVPENAALESWLETMLASNRRPHLAIELHNDESGRLHIGRPEGASPGGYVTRMQRFESLLREFTWFREGSTPSIFTNPGTLGDGWLVRYGIDAVVHELNANRIEGLDDYPRAEHWQLYGRQLCDVFAKYFSSDP